MEEAQIVVDLEASPLSESMQRKLKLQKEKMQHELNKLWGNANEAENFTIFRTPHNISQSKKNLFDPSVISIGPFHHGHKSLQALEEQKWRFLRDFLSRGDHISLDLCISEMNLLETRTRRCYSETFDDLDSDTFVEMMLLDGCFVLEYVLQLFKENSNSIYEVGWNCNFVHSDLLLLENQIPFFIIEKLYEISLKPEPIMIFVKWLALLFCLVLDSLDSIDSLDSLDSIIQTPKTPDTRDSIIADPPAEIPDSIAEIPDPIAEIPDPIAEIPDPIAEMPDPPAEMPDPPAEIHHLVHLCYHYLVPNPDKPVVLSSKPFDLTTMFSNNRIIKGLRHRFRSRLVPRRRSSHLTSQSLSVALSNSTGNISSMVIPSATELKQKGLKFIPKSKPRHMLDISFEYGVLKIPRLKITDSTKPIFANLIAFEQSKYGKENKPFTMFVAFLDNLVNTPNDVTILEECGIVENYLGSEEQLANFINQVGEGAVLGEDHYLAELYKEVNKYSKKSWNRDRAKLIRDYFSNPWAAISLVAAFILLGLTCVQSFYVVYAYKFPPSS